MMHNSQWKGPIVAVAGGFLVLFGDKPFGDNSGISAFFILLGTIIGFIGISMIIKYPKSKEYQDELEKNNTSRKPWE